MDLSSYGSSSFDTARLKRMLGGVVVALAVIGGATTFIVLTSKKASAVTQEDEPIAVELAKEPEPEPEPEPPPPELKPVAAKAGPRLPKIEVPKDISSEKPDEKEPVKTEATGDPLQGAEPGGGGTAKVGSLEPPPPPPPPPPPAAAPEKKAPIRVTEDMPKPEILSKPPAWEYPGDAKAAGIDGKVFVLYFIELDGTVKQAKAVKGPDELKAACETYTKQLRFKPYVYGGEALRLRQMQTCTFKLN